MSRRFVSTLGVIAIMGGLLGVVAAPASAQCLANEIQKLTASDAFLGDHFGVSVCILGDSAIVGAHWDNDAGGQSGSAYVFRFDPRSSSWAQQQKLTALDAQPADEFGFSVAINPLDPNVIIVGAWLDDPDDCNGYFCQVGSAYIFRFDASANEWMQEHKLTASDGTENDQFGYAVSVWGDVAIVGARYDDDGGPTVGSAYVFRYDPLTETWMEKQKLQPSDPELSGRFGTSLYLENDVVIIGSPTNLEAGFQTGAAYVFRYDPQAQLWVQEQKLLPSDPGSSDFFGHTVSLSGDVALIGAPGHNVNGVGGAGAAYVFGFNPDKSGWVQQQQLTAAMPGFFNRFGRSVSLQDNIAVIGTPRADDGEPIAGSVSIFVYDVDALQWTEQARLHSSDLEIGDNFGASVALDGDRVIVGAPLDDDDGTESGSAYIFAGLGDCNENGELDLCDVADGTSTDDNNNGIPDECEPPPPECPWDLDNNGSVGVSDLLSLLASWGPCKGCPADFDENGAVGVSDLLVMLANWGVCP